MTDAESERVVIRGLRDVAAATTQISFVAPRGILYYSGYNIDDLVDQASYEEVIYLLLNNKLPTTNELTELRSHLFSEMRLPLPVVNRIRNASTSCHPMEVLRTEVSHLGEFDPEPDDTSDEANKRRAVRIIAKVPTIISFLYRTRMNQDAVVPIKGNSFAENFLFMFRGRPADEQEKTAMERYMILHADHGLNASTFAARVTAGTGSDLYSAVTSAVGTLKGEFHGGASERVMKMLYEINSIDEVEEYIQTMLDDKKKIMGFGHRVYETEDPRSKHLRVIAEQLCHQKDTLEIYNKCKKIEQTVHDKKGIFPNVDFYAALVMHALGVPREFFTSFFACSRVTGWVAHTLEQYTDAVLIRPTSKYIGAFGREFDPIEKRS
ncbi:MAG: citrate synthase [Candidatus Bathyarchaeota archaeon]|nr:MAG: citrate synthase [Candidatus Bathyarchaeota archaeon]